MMKVYFSLIITLLILSSCGISVIKEYKYRDANIHLQEEALINVQYEYPDIRCSAELEKFDIIDFQKRKSTGISTKTDSLWLASLVKDYYRDPQFGHRTYLFSSLNKKYYFHIKMMDGAKGWRIAIVNCSKNTDNKKVIINKYSNQSDFDEAIKVFEEDILPKITESVNLMKKNMGFNYANIHI